MAPPQLLSDGSDEAGDEELDDELFELLPALLFSSPESGAAAPPTTAAPCCASAFDLGPASGKKLITMPSWHMQQVTIWIEGLIKLHHGTGPWPLACLSVPETSILTLAATGTQEGETYRARCSRMPPPCNHNAEFVILSHRRCIKHSLEPQLEATGSFCGSCPEHTYQGHNIRAPSLAAAAPTTMMPHRLVRPLPRRSPRPGGQRKPAQVAFVSVS